VIASTKKVKSLVNNVHVLTQAIRSSSKLVSIFHGVGHSFWSFSLVFSLIMRLLKVLSTDGKKVKRKHPFTEKEKEDLQVNKLYVFLVFIRMDGVEVSSHCSIVHVSFSFLLQSRTVVAENLPDDHSHQNLQKIFSTVGR